MAKLVLKNLKVGDKVRFANDSYSIYGAVKGDIATVSYRAGNSINVTLDSGQQIGVSIMHLTEAIQTKEQIEGEVKALEAQIAEAKSKLDWMVKTKSEIYDEDEYKVWAVLETLDTKSTQIQKAKAIAALIKGK